MPPVLHTSVGRAFGTVVVLGVGAGMVAFAHIVAPAVGAFFERVWGRA